MVPGVAIHLGYFARMLNENEITHKSLEQMRSEIRSCKSAVSRSKQYFVREEMLETQGAVSRRSQLVC